MPKKDETETTTTETPGEFTAAQQEWLTQLVNRVFTGRSEREKKTESKSADALAEQLTKLKEEIRAEMLGSDPKEVEVSNGKTKKIDSELAAQFNELKNQNAKIMKQLEDERAEKTRIESAQWESTARGTLAAALRKAGVANDDLIAGASELLYKKVTKNAEGKPVIKAQRDGYDEDLDVDKFITSEWAKGQGKSFLPAKPVAGSGGQRAANGNPLRGALTDGEQLSRMRERGLAAMESIVGGGDQD